jgi:hemerythrin superfamily protein
MVFATSTVMGTTKSRAPRNPAGIVQDDAIDMLESQHRAVEDLFDKVAKARAADAKSALFREIADNLAIHAAIEEHHFYPAVKERRTQDILLGSLEAHLGVKRILADMLDVSVTDPIFDAKLKTLKEQVLHHVGEEEETLFPKIRTMFSSDELQDIAARMRDEQEELEGTEPRLNVRSETAEAAPLL